MIACERHKLVKTVIKPLDLDRHLWREECDEVACEANCDCPFWPLHTPTVIQQHQYPMIGHMQRCRGDLGPLATCLGSKVSRGQAGEGVPIGLQNGNIRMQGLALRGRTCSLREGARRQCQQCTQC